MAIPEGGICINEDCVLEISLGVCFELSPRIGELRLALYLQVSLQRCLASHTFPPWSSGFPSLFGWDLDAFWGHTDHHRTCPSSLLTCAFSDAAMAIVGWTALKSVPSWVQHPKRRHANSQPNLLEFGLSFCYTVIISLSIYMH